MSKKTGRPEQRNREAGNPALRASRNGVFVAAGQATRLRTAGNPLTGSKEIVPVGNIRTGWHPVMQRLHPALSPAVSTSHGKRPLVPVGDYLMDSYLQAGVEQCCIVTRAEKQDLLTHYPESLQGPMSIKHLVIEESPSTPFTLACGLRQFLNEPTVREDGTNNEMTFAFGFPDIILSPDNIFSVLFDHLDTNKPDVVLGLFRAPDCTKYDMVSFEKTTSPNTNNASHTAGVLREIDIKPAQTDLQWTWVCAVWNSSFARFLIDAASNTADLDTAREPYVGDLLLAALKEQFSIHCVCFENATMLDIGTPADLELALSEEFSKTSDP